jgi:hypothetical protein
MSITLPGKFLFSLRRLNTVLVHSVPPSATRGAKAFRFFSGHTKPSNDAQSFVTEKMKLFCRGVLTDPAPSALNVKLAQVFISLLFALQVSSQGPDKIEAFRQSIIKEFDIKPPKDLVSGDSSMICVFI